MSNLLWKQFPLFQPSSISFNIPALPILVSTIENSLQAKEDVCVRLHSEKDHKKVRILISDDAGGIPPSERNTLFSPRRSNKMHGTGLGLALAMQLAASMDTDLELLNSNDKGSTFCLSLEQNP